MPPESETHKKRRAVQVVRQLATLYPGEQCLLTHSDPFTLLIAVLLSAQTTDAAVNRISPTLFARWPDASSLAAASRQDVEQVIRTIGLYRSKARNCIACAQRLLSDFGGQVPNTMDELISLPGVGRKTANLVLNGAFGKVCGIAVDTHVFRIAGRLGLTNGKTPSQVEADLMRVYPRKYWSSINHMWVLFGREFCQARRPRCPQCPVGDLCPSYMA
ncbi:MAG: endonuclease III [Coriobacteriales bacterium]|jgi:endonuclease-3|nr:endonuclease III [Coriobacteriales bacterium]